MFFDNASTTKVDDDIIAQIPQLNEDIYYNAGGLYSKGRNSRIFIDTARKSLLNALNASEDDKIIFTGSATEANNLAIKGSLKKNIGKILVSKGEHPSVYNTALDVVASGYNVEFISLDSSGKVDIDDFKSKMTKDVGFVSIMHVSNETGAVNDIALLSEYARSINPNVIFHCDGVQAVGKIKVDLDELAVDMYTISAHKIHGFKGIGALFVKKNMRLKPIIFGGGQEFGLRSGTENLLGIFSLEKAVSNAVKNRLVNYEIVANLKESFLSKISNSGIKYKINSFEDNSPYIISVSFIGCRAETLLNMLDDKGIFVGNGSACSSKNSGNRILESMGLNKQEIEGNLRISFSKNNTTDEVDYLSNSLIDCVNKYISTVR